MGTSEPDEAPTFFANLTSSSLTTDELVIEFRRYTADHSVLFTAGENPELLRQIPAPNPEEAYRRSKLVARIVLPFVAARQIQRYLNQAIPPTEVKRRAGE